MPPHMTDTDRVILFDGVCKLCDACCQFVIKHDHEKHFKLASMQSAKGQAILSYFNRPIDVFETMLCVEGNQVLEKSDAAIAILRRFHQPWKSLAVIRLLPKSVRDWFYDRIARNRYTLFGKYEQCLLPAPDQDEHFL